MDTLGAGEEAPWGGLWPGGTLGGFGRGGTLGDCGVGTLGRAVGGEAPWGAMGGSLGLGTHRRCAVRGSTCMASSSTLRPPSQSPWSAWLWKSSP